MIVVFGCGPAGLLAAQAASTTGQDVHIISLKKPSIMRGAMYVHKEIPDITYEPNGVLKYVKVGTKEGYAKKVYGDPEAPCSWDRYEGEYTFWSMPAVYEVLWQKWEEKIYDQRVNAKVFRELRLTPQVQLIINSVPLQQLCRHPDLYQWESERVYITDHSIVNEDTILYNGLEGDPWYRSSTICGHRSTEYPADQAPDALEHGFFVTKPLRTTCDIPRAYQHVLCVGRYGKWAKDELVHDAYYDTLQRVQEMGL